MHKAAMKQTNKKTFKHSKRVVALLYFPNEQNEELGISKKA